MPSACAGSRSTRCVEQRADAPGRTCSAASASGAVGRGCATRTTGHAASAVDVASHRNDHSTSFHATVPFDLTERAAQTAHPSCRWLSANESRRTPTLSSSVRCKLASGVGFSIPNVPAALHLPGRAAGDEDRQVRRGRERWDCPCRCRTGRASDRAASRCPPAWPSASRGTRRTARRGTG